MQVDRQYPRKVTQWWYGCGQDIEQGDGPATMMMEKDMMNEDQFMEATVDSSDVSGQSVTATVSLALCVVTAVLGRLAAQH